MYKKHGRRKKETRTRKNCCGNCDAIKTASTTNVEIISLLAIT
jgi:hypothetical protein